MMYTFVDVPRLENKLFNSSLATSEVRKEMIRKY